MCTSTLGNTHQQILYNPTSQEQHELLFVVSLIFFSQYSYTNAQRNASVTSTYYEITKLTEDAEAHLNSYGVVDAEEGVYRIPIDEAINKLATD